MKKHKVGEPKPLKCTDHPYYHGERRPRYTCETCLAIWERVNKAEEEYLEKLFKKSLPGTSDVDRVTEESGHDV